MKNNLYFAIAFILILFSCSKEEETFQSTYDNLTPTELKNLESTMTNELINSTHENGNEMPMNTILVFRTGDGNFGKMLILNNTQEEEYLEFKYELFDFNNKPIIESNFTSVRRTFTFDFETNAQAAPSQDFWWEWNEFNNGGLDGEDKFLVPRGNCIFNVYID